MVKQKYYWNNKEIDETHPQHPVNKAKHAKIFMDELITEHNKLGTKRNLDGLPCGANWALGELLKSIYIIMEEAKILDKTKYTHKDLNQKTKDLSLKHFGIGGTANWGKDFFKALTEAIIVNEVRHEIDSAWEHNS
jgi:hypothetical protein